VGRKLGSDVIFFFGGGGRGGIHIRALIVKIQDNNKKMFYITIDKFSSLEHRHVSTFCRRSSGNLHQFLYKTLLIKRQNKLKVVLNLFMGLFQIFHILLLLKLILCRFLLSQNDCNTVHMLSSKIENAQ
jgi:hypothetical protein